MLTDDLLKKIKKTILQRCRVLSLYLSAGGSSTTLMGQTDEGIGFIGHYLEGQQEPHTGALQFAGHLVRGSETAGGTERRQTVPGPAFPAPSCRRAFMYESVSRSRAERQRQSAHGGAARPGVRKISCCYGNGCRRRTRAMCRVGAGGTLGVSLEAASRPLHLQRAVHEEPQKSTGTGSAQ